jgi:hypothetical protein
LNVGVEVVMKIVAKVIEVIAWFKENGDIRPIKFRMAGAQSEMVIVKIDQIIAVEKEKFAGNVMYLFQCQSEIEGELKRFELKYEVDTCRWILFKI